jgi:cation transport ATPase
MRLARLVPKPIPKLNKAETNMRSARVIHHVPGRIRFKVSVERGDPGLLEKIQRTLGEIPDVHRVRLNHLTGSVVVEYDPKHYATMMESAAKATAHLDLVRLVSPEADRIDTAVRFAEVKLQRLARHSLTAKHLIFAAHLINAQLKQATGNVIDLRVLLPLCLSAYSMVSDKEKPSPLWVTLLIFSFNAFVSLHPPQPEPLV